MVGSASPATVLVVEDEVFIRMVSVDVLEDAGYTVIEAESADEAVRVLESGELVSLLFTDIRMPGRMDGLELAALVNSSWPSVHLLVTSGHCRLSDDEIPDGGRFLPKPYQPAHVVAQIRDILGHG